MKNIIQYVGFFIMLTTASFLFHWFEYNPLVFYGLFSSTIVLSIVLEKWIPYREEWGRYSNDIFEDTLYALSTILLTPMVKAFAVYSIILIGSSLMSITTVVSSQPFVVQLLLALVVSGFLPYWYHRLSHTKSQFLWRIHSVHHSPEKLYWLNGFRFHPINAILNAFLSLFPLLFLGFSEEVVVLAGFINNYVDILNHTNINFKIGIFNYVFNMSELHRWHHSAKEREANTNYSAGALILWDLMFNSHYRPKKNIGDLGLFAQSKENFPFKSIWLQLCLPFCKVKKIISIGLIFILFS